MIDYLKNFNSLIHLNCENYHSQDCDGALNQRIICNFCFANLFCKGHKMRKSHYIKFAVLHDKYLVVSSLFFKNNKIIIINHNNNNNTYNI